MARNKQVREHFSLLNFISIAQSFSASHLYLFTLYSLPFFSTSLLTSAHHISSLFIPSLFCLVHRLFPAEAVECVSPYNFFGNEERITLQVALESFVVIPIVPFVTI